MVKRCWRWFLWGLWGGLLGVGLGLLLVTHSGAASDTGPETLPAPQVHPLPVSLAQWSQGRDNYLDQIKPTEAGYLVWSSFPIKIYIEPGEAPPARQDWFPAVSQAVQDWSQYLPLTLVEQRELADITIQRAALPIRRGKPAGGLGERVRSAQTEYEFYVRRSADAAPLLSHRFRISVRSSQATQFITAAVRHELGHALGIWGHSSLVTDVMYFAQVRNPPPISIRDVNTLKAIYAQPTRLGWSLPKSLDLLPN